MSGQEFHFGYTFGKKFDNWIFGLGSYFYKQITNDTLNGLKLWPNGNKGQNFAIGHQIKCEYKNISFTLKYQKEMEVKNRPEGDNF